MPTLTIRNLDNTTKHRLRLRAAEHACSMEEEARAILRAAVADAAPTQGLGSAIHALFAEQGGVELDLPPRAPSREPPRFD
jgi:plasmid stability protein